MKLKFERLFENETVFFFCFVTKKPSLYATVEKSNDFRLDVYEVVDFFQSLSFLLSPQWWDFDKKKKKLKDSLLRSRSFCKESHTRVFCGQAENCISRSLKRCIIVVQGIKYNGRWQLMRTRERSYKKWFWI